jgi:hypothetical protein
MANGCTDHTPDVASKLLTELVIKHRCQDSIDARVVNLTERGKVNAWNSFVHQHSALEARFLFMMDADILIHRCETMWNMLSTLDQDAEATVAVDVPRKDIGFKERRSVADRLSLATSRMTLSSEGQLCGQLYCIRAEEARRMYLPKDLAACEDGFIKILACTDFLSHPAWPKRIRVAPGAEHTFEAYTHPFAIIKNQKRQIIGQTIVHVLADQYLDRLPAAERQDLGKCLKAKDAQDPDWLKRLISEHLQRTRYCWRLYPGLLSHRFRGLRKLGLIQRLVCLPAAFAGAGATLVASMLAYSSLKRGCINYWPKARRAGFERQNGQRKAPSELKAVSLGQVGGLE